MGNPIWFIFWFLIFWFISFFVAFFCAGVYIIVYILVICFPGMSGFTDILLQCIQFPHYCAKAMLECRSPF
ncbi:uncharacterized protein LOC119638750 [Glossina fuscipes]|uniref:Uncharacterized protein LOC119638750 n=2 Tax=Nemorhina TaxID=44051 RepID=A0A9C6DUF8_9MUSC|nr:uncharacterized protein LOC119638750 [Glossina fuscipes]KAI9580489.1 hypothetical protein GQX74_012570 [Glossina fuscipes]